MTQYKKSLILFFLFIIASLTACLPAVQAKPTATLKPPSLMPTPLPRTLKICMGYEPDSLYPLGVYSQVSKSILEAVYDGPFDTRNYQTSAVILEKIPSVDNGDIAFQPVAVKIGDEVIDANGNLVSLTSGVSVFPHGCTSSDCIVKWDGTTPLQMDAMSVTFRLKTGLKWSDGQPLTSADSVYSFQVDSDPATPTLKDSIDKTDSYTAVDNLKVKWVSKPGLVTDHTGQYFWFPLPQHAWGKFTPQQLLTADESSKRPLGWGPYMIQSWQAGKSIRLARNPNYFRAKEGLPKFEFLEFSFLGQNEDPVDAIKSGKCDFVDNSAVQYNSYPTVLASQKADQIETFISPGREWEFIALGIEPASYDDSYNPYGSDRPAIFDDLRTRQALAYCIDREGIDQELLFGLSEVPSSYLPSSDPLQPKDLVLLPFDQAKGNALLTAAGWTDYDNNPATPRVAINVKNVPDGTVLRMNYVTSDAPLRKQVAQRIVSSLAQCGFQVDLTINSINDIYQTAPDGLVFGRKFDLVQLSWRLDDQPDCAMFTTSEIPTQMNFWLGATTGGANFMGYSNPQVDTACAAAQRAGLNSQSYIARQQEVMRVINQDLPVIPLYFHPSISLARKDLCGVENDPSARDDLWNIEQFDYGQGCSKK